MISRSINIAGLLLIWEISGIGLLNICSNYTSTHSQGQFKTCLCPTYKPIYRPYT